MGIAAVLVGNSTLVVRCTELLLTHGIEVVGIATRNGQVAAWCEQRGVACEPLPGRGAEGIFTDRTFDYLFSVANLDILPEALIRRAGKMAFNFHDGPLPQMAGLNTPVWALMAGAPQHAVTWHEMTGDLDAGRIAVTQSIEVSEDETAFSLNAKCYEAGLATFDRLVEAILCNQVTLAPQSGPRSFTTRAKRPQFGGLIDPSASPEAIGRSVRALDHGPYWNPLALAKIATSAGVFSVSGIAPGPAMREVAPTGTILSRDASGVTVAASGSRIQLTGLSTLDGKPAAADTIVALAPGQKLLAAPDGAQGRLLQEITDQSGRDEAYWIAYLGGAEETAELGYPGATSSAAGRDAVGSWHKVELGMGLATASAVLELSSESVLLTALAIWLGRTAAGGLPFAAIDAPLPEVGCDLAPALFLDWRPLRLGIDAKRTVRAAASVFDQESEALRRRGPLARDLESRLLRTDAPAARWPRPLARIVPDTKLDSAGLRASGDGMPPIMLLVEDTGAVPSMLIDARRFTLATAHAMARHLAHVIGQLAQHPDAAIGDIDVVPADETKLFLAIDAATVRAIEPQLIDQQIARQALKTPERIALRWHARCLSYAELDAAAERLAKHLANLGASVGKRVAVSLERTPAMVVSLIAILRTGAAYVPIDPRFPTERINFIREDCDAHLVITDQPALGGRHAIIVNSMGEVESFSVEAATRGGCEAASASPQRAPDDLAYLTYTSGSTGKPKGVGVTHGNVANFFAGMDQRVPRADGGTWLAVTSISFDISVLELLWTLTRGYTVALHSRTPDDGAVEMATTTRELGFSLFYFAAAGEPQGDAQVPTGRDAYRLLMEGARFADAHGFEAVWTPERHFHGFGGIYPNPAVVGAAIAAITRQISIRAGSCVLPLHDPLRVAEDWALVDNLSGGRTGIAFASGWMPGDFVLAPEAFASRKALMLEHMDTIARLWAGDTVERLRPDGINAAIGTLPRPIQKSLPTWLTAAKNPETFVLAGRRGNNILTHMLGMSIDELAENIAAYRSAWTAAGHTGRGRVSVMLHTFVGEDEQTVRHIVRAPMKAYLASAVDIVREAAWNFPTLVRKDAAAFDASRATLDASALSPDELDAVLEHAFDRYYETSGLFGTPERCVDMAARLKALGVDELACLIDFGVDTDTVLQSLPLLAEVMQSANGGGRTAAAQLTVGDDIERHDVRHLQCTPSMAAMLMADDDGRRALGRLDTLLVGGEALPPDMAAKLAGIVRGKVLNMYGPTETTVWSTVAEITGREHFVPLGTPIANTSLDVVDSAGRSLPALVAGELLIGGDGVAQGYWRRADLTAERFVMHTRGRRPQRYYRTGDLVRRHEDGSLEFLGRIDHQVKIRGHRIELGEIEAALASAPGVAGGVVVAHEDPSGPALAGFIVPAAGVRLDSANVRQHLAARLPAIMVPAKLTVLAAFPQTPNGKIDRNALAKEAQRPAAEAPSQRAHQVLPPRGRPAAGAAASTPGEAALAEKIGAVWARLLGREMIEAEQNFFDLGGHSLLAVELHRLLTREVGLDLKLTDIFRFPTIEGLCRHVGALQSGVSVAPNGSSETAGAERARLRLAMTRRGRPASAPAANIAPANGGRHE